MRHGHLTRPGMARALRIATVAGCLVTGAPDPASTQQDADGTVSVDGIGLSADTVGIGDLIDLSFVVELPAGIVAFLPDSLDTSAFESFEPVRWSSDPQDDGGARLTVTYPLIAFQVGGIAVPDFPIFVARAREAQAAGFSSEGDVVGSWSAFRAEPAATPSARMLRIPPQPLWVVSVLEIEDASNGVQPRPIADVVGGARHWPATILLVIFGALSAGILFSSGRAIWIGIRDRPVPPPDPRLTALAAFDDLIAEGSHRGGDVRAFYTRASDITRRFVEVLEDAWGPAHTSTELMSDLEAARRREGFSSTPEVEPLTSVMEHAERVKFGGDRPDADEAEQEVDTVRGWIERSETP